jgi:ABC-type glycerol-3-phosphate transport system permease component
MAGRQLLSGLVDPSPGDGGKGERWTGDAQLAAGPAGRTAFDVLMAGSVVSVLPMLLLFLLLQRHLVVGLTAGAVRE